MQIITISYHPEHEYRGLGDLYLPETAEQKYPVLLIHGGGWNAMDKQGVCGIAEFLCRELQYPVYNINYRLCGNDPWPACGNDCLEAAEFLLNSTLPEFSSLNRKRIFVIGGSAGGHLALMTGLRLPENNVAGIVSISGISSIIPDYEMFPDRYRCLLGKEPDPASLNSLEPAQFLKKTSPPILLTHDYMDNVVPQTCPVKFMEAAERAGITPDSFFYRKEENGFSHRIWIPDSSPHKLYREIEMEIEKFLRKLS